MSQSPNSDCFVVCASRSAIIFLPVCLAAAIFSGACSLRSTPSVSDAVSNQETGAAEQMLAPEESMQAPEHKSIPDHPLSAKNDSPKPTGIYHKVRRGQTLSSISRFYKVPLDRLMRANRISDPTKIRAGTSIFIPRSSGPVRPQATILGALSWPLRGRITAKFGPRGERSRHEGIDIDGQGGDEVRAAAAGTVIQAGTRGNYGRMVVLEHGEGLATLYAHVSKLMVRLGDRRRAWRSHRSRGPHRKCDRYPPSF